MRCKTCDYPLWNLKARQCPECGAAFTPADFEFRINSVQFCCPLCEQPYYGTSEKGHLVPSQFNCVRCSNPIGMDVMMLRPVGGLSDQQTQADQMPWIERKKIGRTKAWFKTVGMALAMPTRLMKLTPDRDLMSNAWRFAIVTQAVIVAVLGMPFICFMVGMPLLMGGGRMGAGLAGMAAGLALTFLIGMASILLAMAIWGAITHGLLRMTGETAGGFGSTYCAICYSCGANALSATPCVGAYFGWIWWIVSAVLMVKERQAVSGGRASFAVLLFPVGSLLLLVVGYLAFFAWLATTMPANQTRFGTAMSNTGRMPEANSVMRALQMHAQIHQGFGPPHGIVLVESKLLSAAELVDWSGGGDDANVPLDGSTLEQYQYLAPNRQRKIVKSVVDAMPDTVVAHRVAGVVFTYHGINLQTADPKLWIVIMSPDPDAQISLPSIITVGMLDGSTTNINGDFNVALNVQNELRAKWSLPPLINPQFISNSQPQLGAAAPCAVEPNDVLDLNIDADPPHPNEDKNQH